jgi:cytochrome c553
VSVSLAIVGTVLVALLIWKRGSGVSAVNGEPWSVERRVAKSTWRFLVPANMRDASNPVSPTPAVLKDVRAHWADHCALCHDNDGSGATSLGRRLYPRVPDLREATTQRLTDGELFYAIEQGIPFTGMPGWATRTPEGERDSWALVHFIRRLSSLTPSDLEEMERLNPKAPPDSDRERDIEDFLKGPPTAK